MTYFGSGYEATCDHYWYSLFSRLKIFLPRKEIQRYVNSSIASFLSCCHSGKKNGDGWNAKSCTAWPSDKQQITFSNLYACTELTLVEDPMHILSKAFG